MKLHQRQQMRNHQKKVKIHHLEELDMNNQKEIKCTSRNKWKCRKKVNAPVIPNVDTQEETDDTDLHVRNKTESECSSNQVQGTKQWIREKRGFNKSVLLLSIRVIGRGRFKKNMWNITIKFFLFL